LRHVSYLCRNGREVATIKAKVGGSEQWAGFAILTQLECIAGHPV